MSERPDEENDHEHGQSDERSGGKADEPDEQRGRPQDSSEDEGEEDRERQRIHEGHEKVEPEPGVTAGLDQFTEEEKRQEPAGVNPGAGPDEEPGPDRDRRDDGGDQKENGDK